MSRPPTADSPPGGDRPIGFPIDILHVSDLHFRRRDERRGLAERSDFQALLGHVRSCVKSGCFRPAIIACTGDLVDSPSRPGIRIGVRALLQLAEACGLVESAERWSPGEPSPPAQWRALVNRRIFLVPGNHDVHFKGLRLGWHRVRSPWRALGAVCDCADLGPLAVITLDSNGRPALYGVARGEVLHQERLRWGEVGTGLRIALVHAHPVQLPFFLTGVIDGEASMVMENAGLLMKNLAQNRVRLVLHGHRHYPGVCNLSLPDATGRAQQITVVGAGSVTSPPPKGWPYAGFDWIRIHPDRRIDVHMVQRGKGEPEFVFSKPTPYFTSPGDFRYDRLRKRVRIDPETGDMDIGIEMIGFQVSSGRPEVGAIPFDVSLSPVTHLAVHRVAVRKGGMGHPALEWRRESKSIDIDPPHRSEAPPIDLEISYFLHNAVAMNRFEAQEMYGRQDREHTELNPSCQTRELAIEVDFQGRVDWLAEGDFGVTVLDRSGAADPRRSDDLTRTLRYDPEAGRLECSCVNPSTDFKYRLWWKLPEPEPIPEAARTLLLGIRIWQESQIRQARQGERPLDELCRRIEDELESQGIGRGVEVTLHLPDIRPVREVVGEGDRAERGYLRLVGASFELPDPVADWSLAFGAGVAGRAFRTGKIYRYDVWKARATVQGYRSGARRGRGPANYYLDLPGIPEQRVVIAIPVPPLALGLQIPGLDIRSAQMSLGVLCLASQQADLPLMKLSEKRMGPMVERLVELVESECISDALSLARSLDRGQAAD